MVSHSSESFSQALDLVMVLASTMQSNTHRWLCTSSFTDWAFFLSWLSDVLKRALSLLAWCNAEQSLLESRGYWLVNLVMVPRFSLVISYTCNVPMSI